MNDRLMMSKIHSKFGATGATNEIANTVRKLEDAVITLNDHITSLNKVIDAHMKGKTRDAFIERVNDLERKRRRIENKMRDLRGSIN
jgi:phage host-nuclease inhibitor protein Gam